jgi:hypothetical protein
MVSKMRMDLDAKLINKSSITDCNIEEFTYQSFQSYCTSGNHEAIIKLHDGDNCTFSIDQVDHAFRETIIDGGRQTKGKWDRPRIRRIPWMLPIITGGVHHTSAYFIKAGDEDGWSKDRRIYIYGQYVIWLHKTGRY